MAFCPRCSSNHDPNFRCFDRAQEVLSEMESRAGIKRRTKISKAVLKKLERETDRIMIKIFIGCILIALILLIFLRIIF